VDNVHVQLYITKIMSKDSNVVCKCNVKAYCVTFEHVSVYVFVHVCNGGTTNLKMEGSMHWSGGGVNNVKTLPFEKVGGCMTTPAPMVASPLHVCVCV